MSKVRCGSVHLQSCQSQEGFAFPQCFVISRHHHITTQFRSCQNSAVEQVFERWRRWHRDKASVRQRISRALRPCSSYLKLPAAEGESTVDWTFADPALLIPLTLSKSQLLQDVYARALREHPCSSERPWGLVVGFDEFCPGDRMNAAQQGKKCMDLYFNFAELGHVALSQAATWFVPIAVRTDICKRVRGGWSYMLAAFLKRTMLGTSGLATAGIPVEINGSPVLIFAKLKILMSDGDGLRLAYNWKGASSIKPCLKHSNVLKRGSGLACRCAGYVEITEHDYKKFHKTTTAEFHLALDKVAAAHRARAELRMRQELHNQICKTQGFNYCYGGLPFDEALRRAGVDVFQASRVDWVHSALQDGALSIEIHLFISACDRVGKGYRDVEQYFKQAWQFPKYLRSKGVSLYRIFCDYRRNSHGEMEKLKASASEVVGMYSILRHWAESEIGDAPELASELAALRVGCKAIDIILLAKRKVLPMEQAGKSLQEAIRSWYELHKSVYGDEHFKPKHHWMFDIAEQFLLDEENEVFDQLVIERLHLAVKDHGERVDNLRQYERSILAGVLNAQIGHVRKLRQGCALTDETVVSLPGYDHAYLADNMDVLGMNISVGDFVMRQCIAGKVCGCVEELNVLFAIVEPIELLHSGAYYRGRWQSTGRLLLWRAVELEQARESER